MNTKLQFFLNQYVSNYVFLLLAFLFISNVFAKPISDQVLNEKQISLNLNNASITEVLSAIEQKTQFTFIFDDKISGFSKRFSIHTVNESVESILNKISQQSGFEFKRINSTITVIKPDQKPQLVKGKVLDAGGMSLPGASVTEKGTSNTVTTDFDGNFTITVSNSARLVISFIGFEDQEVALSKSPIVIQLKEQTNMLNDVVVTALGIKREEKRLGFAQQTIKADELEKTTPNNWSSALKGKVAGLNITSSGSGPINSQSIILRGNRSIDINDNQALIVVDGVPMQSQMTTSGSSTAYMGDDSPIDYGNGISDLNVDDIQSVTVLKGAGATALYGSRAANGALIITTKSGKKSKGLGVTVTSGATFDVIQRWPDYQYQYGQGTGKGFNKEGELYYSYGASEDGASTSGTSSAYGPAFNNQYYYQYDPILQGQGAERTLWQPYKDNRKDFWNTGVTLNNNISLQGGDKNGSIRASFGNQKNNWIMPNTGFDRYTAAVNANYQISNRIKVGTSINYNNRASDNLPSTGYNNGSIAYFMIFQNPNVDLNWYKPIWMNGLENIDQINPYSSYIDNPYLIAYEATNPLESSQVVGNLFANIDLGNHLDLMVRTSLNTYNQNRQQRRPYSINRYAKGFFKTQDVYMQEINNDFLLSYKNDFSQSFSFSGSLGGNSRSQKYRKMEAEVEGLVVPDVYKLTNGVTTPLVRKDDSNKEVNSLYGLISLAYKDYIFVDVTGRNDWSSTLPLENNSFFYPSVNTSIVFSEMFNMPETIDYLKYRFSFAKVGNDTDPYRTSKYYGQSDFPSSAVTDNTLFNDSFQPEITTSFETGFELYMFNKRLTLDATVYESNTKNQIITVPLDYSTGYSSRITNAGNVRNRGVEIILGATIIDNPGFKWKSTLNWSRNWNKILELADGADDQFVIGEGGTASLIGKVGGTTTAMYGYGFVRDPQGNIVYDEAGLPAYPDDIQYIGDASPDWKAGFTNSFSIGNFTASVTLDGQYGGVIYSQTHHKMMEQGKLEGTLMGREEGYIIGDGVVLNADGSYSENTTKVTLPDYYTRYYRRANIESNSFDASYLKLRELSFAYEFPKKWLRNTGLQAVQFAVFGRDLAVISDFPIYDPETAALNGNTILPGIEMGQMPSPANYGFNLKFNF
ncbi:SusC/RagA family TonB-linked outer membrane protein [Flavobacterium agrisoli]|uniref:SusC/RagA family TonB-linked outer membrane protein n=1 Tax=Flavobacterium agrisoli TaxID=2793066 RepID=A0A934PLK9_9FLAO|nr:SusC/RagA family TonB-linked outer membrane protein [Flavobacterium agrisoli]MBK0369188.1 SusC/RagA family TonB-linked outer membrane protein [Flavobacterium agrisoli]